jgi:glutamate-1-semialdehyde 2,1-aminomutase
VFRIGAAMMEGISRMLREADVPGQVIGAPVMFDVIFATGDIADYRATLRADAAMTRRFNNVVRANGVLKSDGKSYVGLCHTGADVADVLRAFRAGIEAISQA